MEVSMMGTRWELWELSMHPMIKAVLYLLVNVSDPVNFRSATHVNCLSFSQISVPSLSTFPPWHGFMNHLLEYPEAVRACAMCRYPRIPHFYCFYSFFGL